jgi:hypothetical protein
MSLNVPASDSSNTQSRLPHGFAWGLLLVWLLYSGGVLGWHLANDPFLSTYICRVR